MSQDTLAIPLRLGRERRNGLKTLGVVRPFDGQRLESVHLASTADVTAAIERAHAAFGPLSRASAHLRRKALDVAANLLEKRADETARTITDEAGKPIKLARAEVDRALSTIRSCAEEAVRVGGEVVPLEVSAVGAGKRGVVRRFARGVVAAISPFNFPLNLLTHKVAPAIAAGCPVVAKPSERTPLTAHILGDCIAQGLEAAGLPVDAISILPAFPDSVGPLLDDPRVRVVSFTGGVATGWKLRERAASKDVVLELGGDAAVIVWGDADLDFAARRCAYAAFAYAGQICISVQRVYVQSKVYPEFRERFLAATRELKLGDPRDPDVVVGPLIDDAAADRIEAWTDEAVRAGARVLTRGERKGRLIPPIALEALPDGTKLSCEEAFGPVVALEPVERFETALDRVNGSRFGLQAGLFTRDLPRVEAAFERLEVGALVVNEAPLFRVDTMPYGGVKASGIGREGARYAIESFTEPRLLVTARDEKPVDLDR
jgi:acyl-CoA reductase-like NAD-dependent aldehyde dehydrogenase